MPLYNNVCGRLFVTHKIANINFINSSSVDIIRSSYAIHGLELKLIFAVLYVSQTMGFTRCYKATSVFHLYICSFLPNLC